MFTIESLAEGYNSPRTEGDTGDRNALGNLLIMEVRQNTKSFKTTTNPREVGIALFSICHSSKTEDSEESEHYKIGLMFAFWNLYRAHNIDIKDFEININLYMLFKHNHKTVIKWFEIGIIAKYNITEAIRIGTKFYFVYDTINRFEMALFTGNLDKHEEYEEFCSIILCAVEKTFSLSQALMNED